MKHWPQTWHCNSDSPRCGLSFGFCLCPSLPAPACRVSSSAPLAPTGCHLCVGFSAVLVLCAPTEGGWGLVLATKPGARGGRQSSGFRALIIWSNMIYSELGRDFAGGMKASNQLTLKDYPGLAEEPWCNHGGPSKQQTKAEGSEEGGRGRSENFEPWKRLYCDNLVEKEMATHSSVLAWRIPGTEEPGGLPSVGSHRVGHDWSDLAVAAVTT